MEPETETVADVIDAVAAGRIGHREAMRRLRLASYPDLVETVRLNGRKMWAHKAATIDPETVDLLRRTCRTGTLVEPSDPDKHGLM